MMKNTIIVAAVTLIALFAQPLVATGQRPLFLVGNPNVGKEAKDFTLERISGGEASLEEVRQGDKAIVFFWATWCPNCRETLTRLKEKRQEIEDQNIKLILVDVGEEAAVVNKYITNNKVGMDSFLDKETEISGLYGVLGLPTFVFVGEDGVIRKVQNAFPQDLESPFYGG